MTERESWDPDPYHEMTQLQSDDEDKWQNDVHEAREEQRKRVVRWSLLGSAIALIGLGLIVWLLIIYDRSSDQGHRIDSLEGVNEERQSDLDRTTDAIDDLRRQVEGLGGVPVAPPAEELVEDSGASEPDDPDPDDPESQDPEVQDPEEQEPETQDLEANDPDPDDPEFNDPDPNDAVTFDMLMAVLTAFCEENDGCRGPEGAAGQDGLDGATTCPAGFHFVLINIPSHEDAFLICVQD